LPVGLIGRLILLQLMIGIGGGVVWLLLRGPDWAIAALTGGGISIFLTLFVALRFFLRTRNAPPRKVTGVLYQTEALKFLLAVVLLGSATYHYGASAAALVTTFAATLAAYWIILLWSHR